MTPPAPLLGGAEALINRLLAQDPHSLNALTALGGSLLVRHAELDWDVGIFPASHGIVLAEPDPQPRARVELQTRAVLALLREPRGGRAVAGMQIAGDAEYLQKFAEIFQNLHTDLAAFLEPWFGAQAVPLAQGLGRARQFLQRAFGQLEQSGVEFLAEESRDLVPAAELEDWMHEVDELSMAVDRAQARLGRLEQSRGLS